jgi:hypothetical protein
VLSHHAAHGRAVALVIVLLDAEGVLAGDLEVVGDIFADALVDLVPQVEMMRIERVVEIVTAQVWVSSDLEFPQQDFGLLHEGGNEVPALLSRG